MSALTEPCTDCGRPVTREMPEDLRPSFARVLEQIRPYCDECVEKAEREEALKYDPHPERLRRSGIPSLFIGKRLIADQGNHDALEIVRLWFKRDDWLPAPAFFGLPGRGKSHLLSAICVRAIQRDRPALFCSARGLLRRLQQFDSEAQDVWQRARSVRLLALDDLGAEQATDWRHDQISELIDERYERGLPIVIATNYPPSMWSEVMDERTASRLKGMVVPVELKGEDRREP